jgi:nucleotide-binding universal stress UspA family protein
LGSRGRSTLRDLIGRTSHSVMSHTSVATLVVSPDADATALDRCGPIVCGVDETAASLHAADEAAALASAATTDLVLVAAPSPQMSTSPAPLSGVASVGQAPLTIERERRLLRDIAEGIAESTAERATTRVIIDAGDPATRLNAIAAELDSCLLVIGGSTGSSIEDALRGSVARSLSGSASRAVLVVPSVRHA